MSAMKFTDALRGAAKSPDSWDVPGLLNDAADSIDHLRRYVDALSNAERAGNLAAFLRRFLNPEELGHAVPAHVRDDVREVLGMERVEGSTL